MVETKQKARIKSGRILLGCIFLLSLMQVIFLFSRQKSMKLLSSYAEFFHGIPEDENYAYNFDRDVYKIDDNNITLDNVDTKPPPKLSNSIRSVESTQNDDESDEEFIPIPSLSKEENQNLPHPRAGSRYPNGTFGYIADPTELRRNVLAFHDNNGIIDSKYFDRIVNLYRRYRKGTITENVTLSSDYVCNLGPGRSFEGEGGFKLLTEKLKLYNKEQQDPPSPRILCSIYTYRKMRDLARTQALSWGYQCDGWLAFSTETIPELGFLEILHKGEEDYFNMWQKVRSIWAYIHQHYLDQFDYFHLGGDDLYIMVSNMRRFLMQVESRKEYPEEPIFLGSRLFNPDMVAGAPGYTLNRKALSLFAKVMDKKCGQDSTASFEDRIISTCFLRVLNVSIGDTRDMDNGEQQYHDVGPEQLYTFRSGNKTRGTSFHGKAAFRWEQLPHPKRKNEKTGPKHQLQAAAKYSITLHDIYHPIYVARVHSLLYPETCPSESVLGRALQLYGIINDNLS